MEASLNKACLFFMVYAYGKLSLKKKPHMKSCGAFNVLEKAF